MYFCTYVLIEAGGSDYVLLRKLQLGIKNTVVITKHASNSII